MILRVEGELFFANARWFRGTVRSLVRGQSPPVREVLVHAGAVPYIRGSGLSVGGSPCPVCVPDGRRLHVTLF